MNPVFDEKTITNKQIRLATLVLVVKKFMKLWSDTVKLGNKERLDKELLALRNNFRATKKFLIAKFDCNTKICFVSKNKNLLF